MVMSMNITKLRLQAIAIVIAYRVVLDDDEYISAMATACKLVYSSDGEPDIFKLLFGEQMSEYIQDKYAYYHLEREILMEEGVPAFIKVSFLEEVKKGKDSVKASEARTQWENLKRDLKSFARKHS
jgi:hypothetical protein